MNAAARPGRHAQAVFRLSLIALYSLAAAGCVKDPSLLAGIGGAVIRDGPPEWDGENQRLALHASYAPNELMAYGLSAFVDASSNAAVVHADWPIGEILSSIAYVDCPAEVERFVIVSPFAGVWASSDSGDPLGVALGIRLGGGLRFFRKGSLQLQYSPHWMFGVRGETVTVEELLLAWSWAL